MLLGIPYKLYKHVDFDYRRKDYVETTVAELYLPVSIAVPRLMMHKILTSHPMGQYELIVDGSEESKIKEIVRVRDSAIQPWFELDAWARMVIKDDINLRKYKHKAIPPCQIQKYLTNPLHHSNATVSRFLYTRSNDEEGPYNINLFPAAIEKISHGLTYFDMSKIFWNQGLFWNSAIWSKMEWKTECVHYMILKTLITEYERRHRNTV